MKEISNKLKRTNNILIDINELIPKNERILLDIKPWLWQEIALKENIFRSYIEKHNWDKYKNKFVAIYCSADAIIPNWAYMLVSLSLVGFAEFIFYGTLNKMEKVILEKSINENLKLEDYKNKRIIIKGCGKSIHINAYTTLVSRLKPIAKSIMYGELCSTVPLYKK